MKPEIALASTMNPFYIKKTMCPLGYHHNGFMATDVLGDMM